MQLTVYWSNLFIAIGVFVVSWLTTSNRILESLGIALASFTLANLLENGRRLFGLAPRASNLGLVKPSRHNPRKEDQLISENSEKNETDAENKIND